MPSFAKFMVKDALKNAETIIKKWDQGSSPSSYTQVDSMLVGNNNWVESLQFLKYVCGYESTRWNNVLAMLPSDSKPTEIPYVAAIECLGKFNEAFKADYQRQTSWIVPVRNMRDEIRESVAKKLMPVYKEFCETHLGSKDCSDEEKEPARFVPNDLGNYLDDLFRGMAVSESSSSRLSSSARSIGCLPG